MSNHAIARFRRILGTGETALRGTVIKKLPGEVHAATRQGLRIIQTDSNFVVGDSVMVKGGTVSKVSTAGNPVTFYV